MRGSAKGAVPADGWKVQAGLRFGLVCGHLFRFSPDEGMANRLLRRIGALGAVTAVYCFLIVSGFSIAHSLHRDPQGFYRRRVLRIYLGELSYPLYVLHAPILVLVVRVFGVTSAPILVGLSLVGAIAFYHGLDRPVRFRAKSAKAVSATTRVGTE